LKRQISNKYFFRHFFLICMGTSGTWR
jgi:hypothetical protein